jgi:hypothetical protein
MPMPGHTLTPEERENSLVALNRARGFLRTELSKRARLKTVPDLVFHEDEAAQTGSRIFALLQEVRREDEEHAPDTGDIEETEDAAEAEAAGDEDRQESDAR